MLSLPVWWLLRLVGVLPPAPTELDLACGDYRDTGTYAGGGPTAASSVTLTTCIPVCVRVVRGKVVLVTGASAGLGLKTAETLAAMVRHTGTQ